MAPAALCRVSVPFDHRVFVSVKKGKTVYIAVVLIIESDTMPIANLQSCAVNK